MTDSNTGFDLVVIGGGPGGYVAAIRASQLGLKVGVVEHQRLGGICLNWGCIPTKALLKNAEVYNLMNRDAGEFGITVKDLSFDFGKVIERSRKISERISKGVEYLFKKNKIEHISGYGKIAKKGAVEVYKKPDDTKPAQSLSAKHIIIATGARPRSIPDVKIDGKKILSYFEAMVPKEVPKSMIVIGAGAIGVEFAYFYNAFGTKVTIVEMMPTILPIEDADVSRVVADRFKKSGMDIHTDTKVEKVDTSGKGVTVTIADKEGRKKDISADVALMAIGVQGNVENIGLEKLGVKSEKGAITVDEYYRTNVEGIYAIGDVAGSPWLAHVASHEGIVCVEKIAGHATHPINYENIPGCTYCQPQVASIGLTEARAKEKGYEVKVGRYPFRVHGKAIAAGETEGFTKLIFDAKYGELLGAHIVGSEATEMIAEIGMAKTLEATKEEIVRTVHAHPTFAEAIMEAAGDAYGEAVHL
jgi:dihydrolipoamide dehydrogenase